MGENRDLERAADWHMLLLACLTLTLKSSTEEKLRDDSAHLLCGSLIVRLTYCAALPEPLFQEPDAGPGENLSRQRICTLHTPPHTADFFKILSVEDR